MQDDLDETAKVWNHHIIRHVKGSDVPCGRPNIMYNVPSLYNANDCSIAVPEEEVQACRDECIFRDVCPFDEDVYTLCTQLMRENNWSLSNTLLGCTDLYLKLRDKIRQLV